MNTTGAIRWVERGMVPDKVVRAGIRQLLRARLDEVHADDPEAVARAKQALVMAMHTSPVALLPDMANAQHYELPAAFFELVLGRRRKYSCCLFENDDTTLDEAEEAALAQCAERAGVEDGMRILDLGCGWGSLSLWLAERLPGARIDAVSNAAAQGRFIEAEARRRGLANLSVRTADMNDFKAAQRYDRIVSIEMFEHMRNYALLFSRVHDWLAEDGRFFLHIFTHRSAAYLFEDSGPSDWMSRHFFTGGMMPSDDLPLYFQQHLKVMSHWRLDGRHYARTADAWLANLDASRGTIETLFAEVYGDDTATWIMRWRVFMLACSELFGYNGGNEWGVGHYLFRRGED